MIIDTFIHLLEIIKMFLYVSVLEKFNCDIMLTFLLPTM